MNVLLFGATGLVGRAMVAAAPPEWRLSAPSHTECDITDASAVARCVAKSKPAVAINAAGYANVDAAESDRAAAFLANADAPGGIARACNTAGARLIHLSSDYVFDGLARAPYPEEAAPDPRSAYGLSKLQGERAVRDALPSALVVRTQWVFGHDGKSLVGTMRDRARRGERARVVNDQRARPTCAADLAAVLVSLAGRADVSGLLHVANNGEATAYELAAAVYEHFGRAALVEPITTADLGAPAARPAYSVLALDRLCALGIAPRHWRAALADFMTAT